MDGRPALLVRSDSLLIVVDVQPRFVAAHPEAVGAVARAAWLTGVAAALEVPVLVTEEDPDRNGPTDEAVLGRAPAGTRPFEKHVFGLAGQADILGAVEATGRRTAILVGTETDVCVAQSALGLLARGYRVAVVTDATFSPGEMHELGLHRMREAGVVEIHAKGVYYEWVRTLDEARRFEAVHPDLAEPPGFSL
ncbi:MAG: isochorismatase family protein [Chloroflexi bacterium]|nr:isochorismatase family protein [Chloroflexota bacterium]